MVTDREAERQSLRRQAAAFARRAAKNERISVSAKS
jgi:hypothetical protein